MALHEARSAGRRVRRDVCEVARAFRPLPGVGRVRAPRERPAGDRNLRSVLWPDREDMAPNRPDTRLGPDRLQVPTPGPVVR